jgi:hypothetical protein
VGLADGTPAAPPADMPQPPPGPARHGRAAARSTPSSGWTLDLPFDETADGRRLKLLNIVDEHTREALAMYVSASRKTDQVLPGEC